MGYFPFLKQRIQQFIGILAGNYALQILVFIGTALALHSRQTHWIVLYSLGLVALCITLRQIGFLMRGKQEMWIVQLLYWGGHLFGTWIAVSSMAKDMIELSIVWAAIYPLFLTWILSNSIHDRQQFKRGGLSSKV